MAKYTPEELKRRKRRRKRKKMMRLAMMGVFVVALAFGMVKVVEKMIIPADKTVDTQPEHTAVHIQQPNTNISKQMETWYGYTGDVAQTINLENTIPEIDMVRVPESDPVAINYFDDVVFLGDSLADGFKVYNTSLSLKDSKAVYLTQKSTSPRTFLQPGVKIDAGAGLVDVWAVIEQRQPGKMYITLGTNALMAMEPSEFITSYYQLVEKIRSVSPDTTIYITTIPPTSKDYAAKESRLSKERILEANQLIAKMCTEKNLSLISLYDVAAGRDGYLREEINSDGIHMTPDGYRQWLNYLIEHTVYSPDSPYIPGSPYHKRNIMPSLITE